tara:strand:- start:515 stop:838 length:324 start_codon:yes stop_codon:yes gene_type:complete
MTIVENYVLWLKNNIVESTNKPYETCRDDVAKGMTTRVNRAGVKFNNAGRDASFTHSEISNMDTGGTSKGFRRRMIDPLDVKGKMHVYANGPNQEHFLDVKHYKTKK